MTWYNSGQVPIPATRVDPNGCTYLAFAFFSDSSYEYEGVYIDDLTVTASNLLYDETVLIDLAENDTRQVTFPTFTPDPAYDSIHYRSALSIMKILYQQTDCGSMTFLTNAPVYILETGVGYGTIQAAIELRYLVKPLLQQMVHIMRI